MDSASGLLPKFNRHFLVQEYIRDKICIKILPLSLETEAKLWKNARSRSVEESFKKNPEVDDFLNLISSFLCTDRSVEKFSQRSVQ